MAKKQPIFEYQTLAAFDIVWGNKKSLEPSVLVSTLKRSYVNAYGRVDNHTQNWEGDCTENPPTLREINNLAKQGWRIVSVNVTEFNNAEDHRNLGTLKQGDEEYFMLKTTSTYYTLSRIARNIDAD